MPAVQSYRAPGACNARLPAHSAHQHVHAISFTLVFKVFVVCGVLSLARPKQYLHIHVSAAVREYVRAPTIL